MPDILHLPRQHVPAGKSLPGTTVPGNVLQGNNMLYALCIPFLWFDFRAFANVEDPPT